MKDRFLGRSLLVVLPAIAVFGGCSSSERAQVSFSYVVEPTKGLPPGMDTIYIAPAKLGPTTDPKWSDLCSNILRGLIVESRDSFGTRVDVTDRRDTQVTFDEADLSAAGMSDRPGGNPGQLQAADGAVLSNVDVKVTVDEGSQRTLAGITGWGGGGHGWGHGGGDIRTEEVTTVTRNMTVQTTFKLVDTANNKIWEHYLPTTFTSTDRTKAGIIFGSSQTEAALTPRDRIVATLVEKGAREFVSRLMPTRINVTETVVSSPNKASAEGTRLLRAEAYEAALGQYQLALAADSRDHRSAFGAGVAAEAMGRFDQALSFYQQALVGRDDPEYRQARDRVKAYGNRVRQRT